jgi:hypothetical protein
MQGMANSAAIFLTGPSLKAPPFIRQPARARTQTGFAQPTARTATRPAPSSSFSPVTTARAPFQAGDEPFVPLPHLTSLLPRDGNAPQCQPNGASYGQPPRARSRRKTSPRQLLPPVVREEDVGLALAVQIHSARLSVALLS